LSGIAKPTSAAPYHTGLSQAEADRRLRGEGPNELPRAPRRTRLRIVAELVREPMFGLLLAASVIYVALGDPAEGLILALFATASMSIAVVQESRTEGVLEALRDLTSPRALVVRDGQPQRIAGRDVVRGDLIVLAEGDRVPADATLVESHGVQADESLITGESVPVRKPAGEARSGPPPRPGGDDLPYVYAGTMIVRGRGTALVHATGAASEIGKIGLALGQIEAETPRLTQETRVIVRAVAIAGLSISAVLVLLYGALHGTWLSALLGGVALSMSLLPEEFPLVLTVFMAMGAWRISRVGVLTRRAAAIETLGAATVLCTDKTGTLTQKRMAIAELRIGADVVRLGPASADVPVAPFAGLIEYGALASGADSSDPMDRAFHALLGRLPAREYERGLSLVHEYGLTPSLLAVTQVWALRGAGGFVVAAKGAPEAIAALCRLSTDDLAAIRRTVDDMASRGMRILGVARASFAGGAWPQWPHSFPFEFVGLAGLSDPLRPSVRAAVAECRAAGIRVVMITGDYPVTARAIAKEAGLPDGAVLTGAELDALSDAELAARAAATTIYARVSPEQKLRIVTALKKIGEVVAMTGDGVNDAPSLKAAHIGVAMGGRGTDVAREAAAIVLLDDDFASIVKTVRLGRRIYDNLRKAMGYILAIHVPIAGLSLLPLGLGWPLLFGPIHIAIIEMIIDPVCSIVFEAESEERDVMARPPRDPQSRILSAPLIAWSLIQGGVVLMLVGAVYLTAVWRGLSEGEVRALSFVSLILSNVGLILVNRSFSASLVRALFRPNPVIWWVLGIVGGLLTVTIAWAPARDLLRFGPLHADDLAVTGAAGLGVLLALEVVKPFWRRPLHA